MEGHRRITDLLPAQGQQSENTHPAGQRLPDSFHQLEVMGSGNHHRSHLSQGIHVGLKIGHQWRNALNLIDNNVLGISAEKPPRVVPGELPSVRGFEGHIVVSGKRLLREGRFARLPRTHDRQDGKLIPKVLQFLFASAIDRGRSHEVILNPICTICRLKFQNVRRNCGK